MNKGTVWDVLQLARQQRGSYEEFLQIPTMSMGIYKLPAGSEDTQSPHNEDEAYYVVAGKASINIEGEITPVEPGALVFVPAKAAHRFVDIETDLTLLVFFAPAYGSIKD